MKKSKVALVTGGERGIGKGITLRLAEAGYRIFFTYYFEQKNAEAVLQEIERLGSSGCYCRADFRNTADVEGICKHAAETMGSLDLVVNNAAIMPPRTYQFDLSAQQIDDVLSVNYRGYMLIMRDAIRHWIKRGQTGSIVNIASESAISSHQKFSLYGGIKAAIVRSSANAALDAAPYGIRVNCVLPGAIETIPLEAAHDFGASEEEIAYRETWAKEYIPLRRQGNIREIGNAVVWLASDEAAYITGIGLPVDGGLTLPGLTDTMVGDGEERYGLCTKKKFTEEEMANW